MNIDYLTVNLVCFGLAFSVLMLSLTANSGAIFIFDAIKVILLAVIGPIIAAFCPEINIFALCLIVAGVFSVDNLLDSVRLMFVKV